LSDSFRDELQAALSPAYTIQRELTGGGMSRVFVALEHALGRTVVVKVLKPELGVGVNRERFRREIMLAAQLQHPHIVPVLSAGEHGDLLWYTMPFVEGVSLRDSLTHVGKLSPRTVTRVLHDVLDALAYAHRRGVIHRDIKPGNILHHGSHSLVTDFGVAKALSASLPHSGTTSVGIAIGTPAYMAPEQLAADPNADHRMDLYAVGLLAYELLTGAQPFAGNSPQATMAAQLTRMPAPIEQECPDVPPELAALVMHLLAKHPDDRPPTAEAALAELESFTTPIGGPSSAIPAPSLGAATPVPGLDVSSRERLSTWAAVAAGVLLFAVGLGVVITHRSHDSALARRADSSRLTAPATPVVPGDSTTPPAPAAPVVHLTHEDSLRIAAAVREQMARASRGGARQAGALADMDSLQQALVKAYTDSAVRRARDALRASGLSDITGLMAGESLAGRTRGFRGRFPRGPTPFEMPQGPTPPSAGSRISTRRRGAAIFARRRVAVLPVRNGTPRPELAGVARALTDSLRSSVAEAGYIPVSDAELLQLMATPDMNAQRQLADSLGIGAVITTFLTTRGEEVSAQSLVLDVWRGSPISARSVARLDNPADAVAIVPEVLHVLDRVSWRVRTDPHRVLIFDIENQTGNPSLDSTARQLTAELRKGLAQRLGVSTVADSQAQATTDVLERRAVGSRLGAGALVAGTIYRARDDMVTIRLSVRDMSEDRTLPNVDLRVPRNAVGEQLGALVDAVVAQLSQVNWGPKQAR
jgi:eukaryotic-like serine/threonine-protein kinase